MLVDAIICHADGTQTAEKKEVPDSLFAQPGQAEEAKQ